HFVKVRQVAMALGKPRKAGHLTGQTHGSGWPFVVLDFAHGFSRQSDHCIDRAVKLGPRSESDRAIVNDEIGVGLAEFHMVVLETEGTQLLVSLLHELEVPRRIENDLMALVKQFVYGFKGARQGLTLVVFTGFLLREDGSIYVNQESHACLP